MAKHLWVDELERLIKAVQKYREEIEFNLRLLGNAANVCDQVMGSDAVSQKNIKRLEEGLKELEYVISLTQDVEAALRRSLSDAIAIYEDA